MPPERIELSAAGLQDQRSTTELKRLMKTESQKQFIPIFLMLAGEPIPPYNEFQIRQ
ncbi:Uncharacterized protein APZ42_034423 [Daphnia magna]|uniref:Uncharacterized protein n=1 Tax=Daphnia magna TaxID=35525 RepID=A0A164K516_9CRUS|nr:Uncharacterized protein APZ42_034423 [Daphnia magna]